VTDEAPVPPVYFQYAKAAYAMIRERAVLGRDGELVFTGMVGEVFREVGIPGSQSVRVRALLYDAVSMVDRTYTPCLIRLRKGSNTVPSEIAVLRAPVLADLESAGVGNKLLTSGERRARMLREYGKRLAACEADNGQLKIALQNLESRIRELESKTQ